MIVMKNYLLALLLLVFAGHCFSEELLFSSKYSGELDGYNISSTRTLSLMDNGNYRFQSIASHTIGSITETSDFTLVNEEIRPLRYHYYRKIFGFKKEEWIDFDWENKKATYKRKGKPDKTFVHEDIKPGMYDASLYQLQLQRDAWLSKGTLCEGKVVYDVIKRSRLKHMPFELLEKESLKIQGKMVEAIKVEVQKEDSTRVTTVWLLPALNYHIGKIIHKDEDGDTYEIVLENYTFNEAVFDAIYPKQPRGSITARRQ